MKLVWSNNLADLTPEQRRLALGALYVNAQLKRLQASPSDCQESVSSKPVSITEGANALS